MIAKNILIALFLTLAYNLVFFRTGFGLGFALFLLFVNSAFYFFSDKEAKNKNLALSASAISVLFGFLTVIRANEIVLVLNGLSSILFAFCALYFYKDKDVFSFKIPEFILSPVITFFKGVDSIFKLFSPQALQEEKLDSQLFKSIAKGALIAVPVFGVLLFLLTQADPVFSKYTGDILSNSFERTLFSVIVFVGTLCLSLINIRNDRVVSEENVKMQTHKGYELSVVLGSVAILFGLFISVQFQYLFSQSGERDLASLGVQSLTYSEYVRKGFFELMIATLITSGVMMYVLASVKSLVSKQKLIVQLFSSVVIVETILLIVSAAQRVVLYQIDHGLTRARVFGLIFYAYLGVFLVLLMIQIIKRFHNKAFFASHFLLGLVILLVVNIVNIDGWIAFNKYKPTVNGEIDYSYLSSLSPDAYEAWNDAIVDSETVLGQIEQHSEITAEDYRRVIYIKSALRYLQDHFNYLSHQNWQSFNITNNQAYTFALEKDFAERLEAIRLRVEAIDNKAPLKSKQDVQLDRDTSPPLVR